MAVGGSRLATVIFDVDGTLVDSERDGHRVAFNLAFAEFALPYRWDEETYGRLLGVTGGQRRLDGYLADQGVDAGERARLVAALHARKTELFGTLAAAGKVPARPGTVRLLDELAGAGVTVGVATTGSRAWVEPLLDRHFGLARFAAVVTSDDTSDFKPHPQAYLVALRLLAAEADTTVAVEDSDSGVRAAWAAGLRVVAVTNDYTAAQALAEAAVVLDGFGMPATPAEGGVLNVDALGRIAARPPLPVTRIRSSWPWRAAGRGSQVLGDHTRAVVGPAARSAPGRAIVVRPSSSAILVSWPARRGKLRVDASGASSRWSHPLGSGVPSVGCWRPRG